MKALLRSFVTPAVVALAFATTAMGLTVSIADHGAVSDGKTMNTAAIQSAVDACAAAGGGTVLVPAGVWLSGGIELKSNITLELENGAVLRGSPHLADYPPNGFKHPELGETRCLVWAIGRHNVAIRGEGTIELADTPFFDWKKLRTGLDPADDAKLTGWQKAQCVVTALDRPTQPIFFHECRHVRLDGITVTHSPCWTLVFSCCNDVWLHAVRVDNNLQIPNDDAVHFTGSSNIVVSDCILRAGDDCIAVSAITNPDSPCENILVTNCELTSRSAAIRFGYRAAKVRRVTVSNLVIHDSQRGILLQAGDGGWVEDVAMSNIVMDTHMFAGAWWGKGEPLVITTGDSTSARIRDVTISHVRASAENSIVIIGRHQNISDITLDDWSVRYGYSPNSPLYGRYFDVAPAAPRPSPLNEGHMPWIYADSVAGLHLRNMSHRLRDGETHRLSLDPVLHEVTP
ncbi:MAG TPA: glycosyl hydrolase family 28 protein [Opitutaceae bacterium]|nr:glycosyl hydrolase family 28 protein [Opitutaceae bacterium]